MRGGYHGYFAGPPAVGLLLIRWAAAANYCAIGFTLCAAAASSGSIARAVGLAGIGLAWVACGGLSAAGLASRFAPAVAALLNAAWIVRLAVQQSSIALSAEQWNLLFSTCVAIGLALVGPGAYSADAFFFGRREIDISRLRQKHY